MGVIFTKIPLSPYSSPRNSIGGINSYAAIRVLVSEWSGSVRSALPCGHDRDHTFCPITFKLHIKLSKLWIMRGGTILILCHLVKGQGQIWHFVYKSLCINLVGQIQTAVLVSPITVKLHMKLCMMRAGFLLIWVTGSKVKISFGTLPVKPWGHDKD